MYKAIIIKELRQNVYEKFIDYALNKSDAFMLVTYRDIGDIEEMFRISPSTRASLSKELQLMLLKCDEEGKKRKYKDADIFNKETTPFLQKIEPYIIKKRNYPTEWPSTKTTLSKYQKVDICTYKVCNEVREYLLMPKGLFNWKYPYFPDDLCFFKNGYCWFLTEAHEGYACSYRSNLKDIETLASIGIEFKLDECDISIEKLFYEDYIKHDS